LENKQKHLTGNTYRKRNRRSETATLSRSCARGLGRAWIAAPRRTCFWAMTVTRACVS